MRFSVSTYSFASLMQSDGMTQLDCFVMAKSLGYGAVEVVGMQLPEGMAPADYADTLRKQSQETGLPISNYTIQADFLTGSEGDSDKEIRRVMSEIDLAERMGAKSVRHDATMGYSGSAYQSFDRVLPKLAECCRAVTRYAQTKGISTMVENHGYFAQDSERVEQLFNAVGEENFGLLVDMGNFLCADEDPVRAVARVAPYARYVHAKDFLWRTGTQTDPGPGFFPTRGGNLIRGTIVGHGVVPVDQCLRILRRAGFDGTVAVEFEGLERVQEALAIGLQNLRRFTV